VVNEPRSFLRQDDTKRKGDTVTTTGRASA
jgi:hypothetical protein